MLFVRALLRSTLRSGAFGARCAEVCLQIRVRRPRLGKRFSSEDNVLHIRAAVKAALVAVRVHDQRLGLWTERPAKSLNRAPGAVAPHREIDGYGHDANCTLAALRRALRLASGLATLLALTRLHLRALGLALR